MHSNHRNMSRLIGVIVSLLTLIFMAAPAHNLVQSQNDQLHPMLDTFVYLPVIAGPPSTFDWPQFNLDPQHSGNNTRETTINAGNVHNLTRLFQATLPDVADGAPVYLSAVTTISGTKNLIFVTTKAGRMIALDAQTGAQIWLHQNSGERYTTSSPVIDPNHQYVYSYGLDGRVHKYRADDGTEIAGGGWPEVATFKTSVEKGSAALSMATANGVSYLYVTHGGYPGDAGDYQGHVTAIKLSDGTQHVFNTMCSDQTVHFTFSSPDCSGVQSAIWARVGVVYVSDTHKIYMATGNGTFNPANHYWGDTVFALNPDGTGTNGNPVDSYTPTNYQQLQNADADLGSTAPAILPVPANSNVQHLAVQSGKDAKLRLINLDNLSGQGGIGHTGGEVSPIINVPQGGAVLTAPAVWINPGDKSTWVFIANGNGISGLKLNVDAGGNPSLSKIWQTSLGGTSPIVANGVLYYFSGNIRALNPTSGALLWNDTIYSGGVHWESPILANGILYITDEARHLTAYSLPAR